MLLQTLIRKPTARSTTYDGQVLILHLPVAARMNPPPEATDTADDDDESKGFEAWTALQTATDQPRATCSRILSATHRKPRASKS